MNRNNFKNKLVLGTVQFGLNYGINNSTGKVSDMEIEKILLIASHHQLNYIDTAQAYGDSELRLGKQFAKANNHWKVITKINKQNVERITDSINESCKKLNLNKFYGVIYHDFSSFKKNQGTYKELEKLKQNNVVEKIGFSLYHPHELEYLLQNNINFDLVQIPYSVFDQRFTNYFEELSKKNVAVHVRSVFLQGIVFTALSKLPEYFEEFKSKLLSLSKISKKHDIPKLALCMLFALQNKNISGVVMGVDNSKQYTEIIEKAEKYILTQSIISELINLNETNNNYILPYLWKIK